MKIPEVVGDGLVAVVVGLVLSLFSGVVWLVRRVFTNQKQLELLQQSLEQSARDRDEVRTDIRVMNGKIDNLHTTIITHMQDRK